MALSGNFTTNAPYEGRYMRVDWTATQSIPNNQSTINFTVYPVGGSASYYTTGPTYLYVNGSQLKSWSRQDMYTAKNGHTLWTGTASTTLTHDANGNCSFSASLSTSIYYTSSNASGSGSWALNKIDRASTINTVPAFNVEDGFSCTYTKNNQSFTDTITLSYNGTDIVSSSNYTSGSVITLTDAQILSAYSLLGTKKSGDFTIKLTTYNGSSSVGSSSKTGLGTCAGTARVKVNGTWKRALPWINDNGTWKKALSYTKASGTWERGT